KRLTTVRAVVHHAEYECADVLKLWTHPDPSTIRNGSLQPLLLIEIVKVERVNELTEDRKVGVKRASFFDPLGLGRFWLCLSLLISFKLDASPLHHALVDVDRHLCAHGKRNGIARPAVDLNAPTIEGNDDARVEDILCKV